MSSIFDTSKRSLFAIVAAGMIGGCSGLGLPGFGSDAPETPPPQGPAATIPAAAGGLAAVRMHVAENALKSRDYDTAERLFREAHEDAPKDAAALRGLGETLYARGQFDQAAAAFRDARTMAPNDPANLEGLAKSLISKGSYVEARTLLETAAKSGPSASLLNKLGVARDLSGDGTGAQAAYNAALALDPNNLSTRNNLALSLAISGQYPEAITEMEQVAGDPRAAGRYQTNLAFVYGLAGNMLAVERLTGSLDTPAKAKLKARYDEIRTLASAGERATVLSMVTAEQPHEATAGASTTGKANVAGTSEQQPESGPSATVAKAERTPSQPTAMAGRAKDAPAAAEKHEPEFAAAAAEPDQTENVASAEAVPGASAPSSTEPPQAAAPLAAAAVAVVEPTIKDTSSQPKPETAAEPASKEEPTLPVRAAQPRAVPAAVDVAAVAKNAGPTAKVTAPTAFSGWQVQLGAYRTAKQADRGWKMLVEKAGDMLHGLYRLARSDRPDAKNVVAYRLRTPSLPEKEAATALCKALHGRNIDCLVVHQVTGVWIAAANTQPAAVASAAPAMQEASVPAGSPVSKSPDGSALDQSTAPSAGSPAAESWRVQLAAYRTMAATKKGESLLKDKAGDVLPELQGLTRRNGNGPAGHAVNFRLRTADLPDKAAATTLCSVLKERGIACLVVRHRPDIWGAGG